MDAIVIFSKVNESATIFIPDHDVRMQMILDAGTPTLVDLWDMAQAHREMKIREITRERVNTIEMQGLIAMCEMAVDYKIPPIEYGLPYHLEDAMLRLKQLTYAYVVLRKQRAIRLAMIPPEYYSELIARLWTTAADAYKWRAMLRKLVGLHIDAEGEKYYDTLQAPLAEDAWLALAKTTVNETLQLYDPDNFELMERRLEREQEKFEKYYEKRTRIAFEEWERLHPENGPEQSATGEDVVATEQASNVIVTTAREPSVAQLTQPSVRWSHFTTSDICEEFKEFTDRWYTFGEFTWSTSQGVGTNVFNIKDGMETRAPILPYDIIYNSDTVLCDMPNLLPFKVCTYWRGDIHVKIQVNSNKFQIGQLMACAYYQAGIAKDMKDKRNVYGLSQMDHVIIQASSSNNGELIIPYKNVFPFIPTRAVPGMHSKYGVLNLADLYIVVLNPLATTTNGPKTCKVSVLTKFVNSEFTGTAHGSFCVKPEMGPEMLAVAGAMKMLDYVMPDHNRDNPPLVRQPATFVPTASHNWSSGTGAVDPLHTLRLNPAGQTRHPAACDTPEPMTVDIIASKFGLIKQLEWHTETSDKGKRGYTLWKTWVHPGLKHKMSGDNATTKYVLTPVGIVSSCFSQWRGSLQFKFQIVASQFHTGRLMVGYIPGYHADVSLSKLKASPHAIFDLQEQREFTYEVPFISYRPWWPRKDSGNYQAANSDPPSTLYLMIYNELITMESIPSFAYINVYMSAGKSFEVSIPVQPSISLAWHSTFLYPKEDVTAAVQGSYPYYYGVWHGFGNSGYLLARFGTLSDQVAAFAPLKKKLESNQCIYYTIDNSKFADYPTCTQAKKDVMPTNAIIVDSGHGYAILIPCQTSTGAKLASYAINVLKKSVDDSSITVHYYAATTYSPGIYSTGNPPWVGLVYEGSTPRALEDFEYLVPEGEETSSGIVLSTNKRLAMTAHGKYFYGESFGDLKDLCRRYQLYGQVKLSSLVNTQINKCNFMFHALPQGLILDVGTPSAINETFNRCREGIIPLISSLYRYYRGGLRFRIIFPMQMPTRVWIQHRPDRKFKGETDRNIVTCHTVDTAQAVFNHGYAYYVQHTAVNNVVEFEVPFYNNTCYNLLQRQIRPDESMQWAISLGQVMIGFDLEENADSHKDKWISIYYALADDISFNQWVGGNQFHLLDDNITSGLTHENGPEELTMLTYEERMTIKNEGFSVFRPIASTKEVVKDIVHDVIDESVNEVKGEITSVVDKIYTEFGERMGTMDRASMLAIIGNLLHVAVNPSVGTIATSIVNIIVALGVLSLTAISAATRTLKNIFRPHYGSGEAPQPQNSPPTGNLVPEGPNEDAAAWCSILYNGVLSLFNVAVRKPKNWLQWQHILFKDFVDSTRGANQIFVFVRNTMDCIRHIMDYVLGKTNKDYALLKVLETDSEILRDWCKEVLYLTDPTTKRERRADISYSNRIFDAQAFGQIILTDIGSEFKTDKNTNVLSKLYDKITMLKEDMIEQGNHPHVRKLPFTIYMTGEPGIGKSYLSTRLCVELLLHIKYKTNKGLKCTLNPQSDYWDQCDHQPVLEIDDLWAVNTPGALEKQLLTLFQVCSPIVLSPPKAALEEKKMRYNPEIFYINSNKSFPVYNDVDKQAIWRRRDILILAELSGTKREGCPHCAEGDKAVSIEKVHPSWLSDFHHLRFRIAHNHRDDHTEYSNSMTYDELMIILKGRFAENRVREQINFQNRVKDQELLSTTLEEDADESILVKYANLQDRRYLEYTSIRDRTLWYDFQHLLSQINDKSDAIISSAALKLWTVVNPIAKPIKSVLFCYAKHEADTGECSYRDDYELIHDDEAPISLHTEPVEVKDIEITKLMHEGILDKHNVGKYIDAMRRLEDNGDGLNEILSYYSYMIGRMYRHKPSNVDSLDKILDLIFTNGHKMLQKPYCTHFEYGCDDTIVTDQKIIANINELQVDVSTPCVMRCALKSPYLKYHWYKRWLKMNPTYRLMYNKGNVDRFPAYLRLRETREIVEPDNIIKHFLIYLKLKWENTLKPAARTLMWWIRAAWPKIVSILLGVAMFSAVAAPVYAVASSVSIENQRLEVDKLAALAYAKEQGIDVPTTSWFSQSTGVQVLPEAKVYNSGEPIVRNLKEAIKPTIVHQSSQQVDAVITKIQRNTVLMRIYYDDAVHMDTYRCIMLRGRQMLCLRHYLEVMLSKKDRITRQHLIFDKDSGIRTRGVELPVNFIECPKSYYKGEIEGIAFESNFVIIELPPSIPEFKSLTKFICPWNEWGTIGREGTLVQGADKTIELAISYETSVPRIIDSAGASSQIILTKMFKYDLHGAGMCGSVLLCNNKERPIVGIHVAGMPGHNGFGIAEPIFKELVEGVPVSEYRPQIELAEPTYDDVDLSTVDLGGLLYSIGTVPPQHASHQNSKTQIAPSRVHGVFEVRTEPNPMSKNDPRLPKSEKSPLEHGCTKHGQQNLLIPRALIDKAKEHLREKVIVNVKPLRQEVGVVSEQVAVCGLPEFPEYAPLSFSTSCGFPLCLQKPKNETGKKWLFNLELTDRGYELKGMHAALRKQLDVGYAMRAQGIRVATVFTDCLKDTTLPIEKCKVLGKTRIFSISPVQYTISFRQHLSDFMAAYRRARFNMNHAIGINVNSPEWTNLAHKLQSKGTRIITGDYSNYGPALNLELAEAACEIIIDWYSHYASSESTKTRRVRAILLQELLSAYHLCENFVYRVPCGIPSGSPITDILNSLVGNLYIYASWVGITSMPLSEYERHCWECVYGDDLAINISDAISDVYNTTTMYNWFSKYLIKFTDVDKSGNIVNYHTLDDATFLKHRWKPHPARQMLLTAALDPVSVEGAANWIKPNKQDSPESLTQTNCVMACNLAYGHGPTYYNHVRNKLKQALRNISIFQPLPTWEELDERIFACDTSNNYNHPMDNWYIV